VRSPIRAAQLLIVLPWFLAGCEGASWTLIVSPDGIGSSGGVIFLHVESGTSSAYREDDQTFVGGEQVIRDAATWETVWREHRPGTAPPAVDFTSQMVLAVFMGPQSLGCDSASVNVASVTRAGQGLEVVVDEHHPQGGEECRSNPYDFVSCTRTPGPVSFVRRSVP
jgi:hypothetical protein